MREKNEIRSLWSLKVVCRWALGLVWIWEGLVPKILWNTDVQTELVKSSGLYWPSPDGFLVILGVAMVIAGMIICVGWLERIAMWVATISVMILIILVVGNHPSSLSDLHGGIAKDLCLFACAWAVWTLSPMVPSLKGLNGRS